jgi:DNA-directed RNA polymerase specialized sigma24 family protein
MSLAGSVTGWIGQLKAGDPAAAQKLWENYFRRMIGLARKKLHGTPRRMADEEDVALSAFDSFCRGAAHGRFPQLHDRHDLWQLLFVITARKAFDLKEHEGRLKRGGGAILGESAVARTLAAPEGPALDHLGGREPSPEFAAQMAEECRRLLAGLGDDRLRQIALWKMEGHTTEEIAAKLGCVPRTVERKLQVIRSLWGREPAP